MASVAYFSHGYRSRLGGCRPVPADWVCSLQIRCDPRVTRYRRSADAAWQRREHRTHHPTRGGSPWVPKGDGFPALEAEFPVSDLDCFRTGGQSRSAGSAARARMMYDSSPFTLRIMISRVFT